MVRLAVPPARTRRMLRRRLSWPLRALTPWAWRNLGFAALFAGLLLAWTRTL